MGGKEGTGVATAETNMGYELLFGPHHLSYGMDRQRVQAAGAAGADSGSRTDASVESDPQLENEANRDR